jgi:hypothetical protein
VNPIFLAPKTDEQIDRFLDYVRFMVGRYKGRIVKWELWNEEDGGYWRPDIGKAEKAKWYGRVFCRFADAVHMSNPDAETIFGGLGSPNLEFAQNALAGCPGKVDIVAYHSYPGGPFGIGRPPEEIDTIYGGASFRNRISLMSGVRSNVKFWMNEWGINADAKGSNQSVQARYLPRFYLENLSHNVRSFVWEFMSATDGNEEDRMGIVKGDTQGPDAFQQRQSYLAFQNLSAIFGQTDPDPDHKNALAPVKNYGPNELREFWFRDRVSGRRVFAYWLAIAANPEDNLKPVMTEMIITDNSITSPVLMDIRTGEVRELRWENRARRSVKVPVKDSVMAVADAKFLNWPEVPLTPELVAQRSGEHVKLYWKQSSRALKYEVERSDDFEPWRRIGEVSAPSADFSDKASSEHRSTYRVRADDANGWSPWSNPAWVGQ